MQACTNIKHAIQLKCIWFIAGVEALRVGDGYFESGTGPILFAYVNCDGTESKLADCSYSYYDYGASHTGDAGVRCQRTLTTSKEDV